MNSKVYKWCAVPLCKNTSIKTPKKLFVYVPNKKIVRDKWLKLARRNPADVVTNSPIYFCEDHFDLPNDMENYMEYHLMGSVSQVRTKPGCIPKNFACQSDRETRTSDTIERPYIRKRRKMMTVEECEKQLEESSMVTENFDAEEIASGSSAMSAKPKNFKRCIFTESDCHKLVDIVTNYKNIVECKKSDAVTWKQKAAGWEKIAELYNSTTTERRTADQLRCKFDNLKKDVRKYEAQKTQNMLRTGGKIEEVDINEAMKLLYAKVKGIIGLPVKSLEPSIGDSDDVFSTDSNSVEPYINNMQILYEAEASSQAVKLEEDSSSIDVFVNNMEELQETDNIPSTSQVVKLEEDFGGSSGEEVKEVDYQISDTPAQEHGKEVVEKNDWLDYTGKKLQPRKHTALKTKRKRSDSINTKEQQIILKMELLEEEAARNKEYHGERMKREQEVHILKSKNLVLQNEKLELEIQLLKKQLGTP